MHHHNSTGLNHSLKSHSVEVNSGRIVHTLPGKHMASCSQIAILKDINHYSMRIDNLDVGVTGFLNIERNGCFPLNRVRIIFAQFKWLQ